MGSVPPSGACLDAETLAVWADNALSRSERAAVEAHAAGCERCQALLASIVRTLRDRPMDDVRGRATPTHEVWRRALTWAVPLTAAAAVVIYLVVPIGRRSVELSRPSPTAVVPYAVQPAAPAAPQEAEQRNRLATRAESRDLPNAKADKPERLDAVSKRAKATDDEAKSAAAKEPPAAAVTVEAAPPTAVVAKPVTESDRARAQSQNLRAAVTAAEREVEIVSPDPRRRWRIVGGGAVQRSTDGGMTWLLQQPEVVGTLTAGASPSPTVCWLVGSSGTVLLSTDGESWQRISFPEVTDLIAVRATDDKTATVTTADGRTFSTTDRGATWVQ